MIPSFLKISVSLLEPTLRDLDIDICNLQVPETPHSPTVKGTKEQKSPDSSNPNLSSPAIPAANGTVIPLDSDTPTSSKRKRQSEPECKKKTKKRTKKNRKTDKFVVEEEQDSELNTDSHTTTALEIPPTSSQPTPSKYEHSQAKKDRKQKKKAERSSITPTTPTAANQTPASVTPKLEGSLTPGGRLKIPRGSRTREKDSLKIGFYTPEEVEKIETFKLNFCTTHGLPSTTFDEMVQHSERGGNGDFPVSTDVISKYDFWNEIYSLVPDRDRRSVYRFMRRHFQTSTQKAHDWSKKQEDELIRLVAHHGPKWTYIGKLIGRSDDDVTQRWKNKLEHQGTMNQGPWGEDETKTFLEAMEASWHNMKPLLEKSTGKDFYDLDEKMVVWGNVSKEMGHRRSRQQCSDKWRKIVKQVRTMRANGMPDAVFDPKMAAKTAANWNGRLAANQKSAEFVDEDDDNVTNEGPESTNPRSETNPEHAQQLSGLAHSVPGSENEAEPDHGAQSRAESGPELPEPPKKSKKSKSKRKRGEEADSDAAVQPDSQTQAGEGGEPELPPTLKKSKRRHTNAPSDAVEEPSSSLTTPKKTKAERKREKKEQQEREDQAIAEAKAKKDEKAARKQAKRAEKDEEARLAAHAEIPESPKNKKSSKKSKQASSDETDSRNTAQSSRSNSDSSNLPAELFSAAVASDQDLSDSDGVDDSDVQMKYESDSDEL
jgi:hypothetical protein